MWFVPHHFKHLLGEVMVDEGRLQSKIPGRVDSRFVLWWFRGRFTNCQQVCVQQRGNKNTDINISLINLRDKNSRFHPV